MNSDILLLLPPVWYAEQPPLGLPTLYSYLKENKINVAQYDLNIEFFNTICSKNWIKEKIVGINNEIVAMEHKNTLSSFERNIYFNKVIAKSGLEKVLHKTEVALNNLHNNYEYYNLNSWINSQLMINEILHYISKCYVDTQIDTTHYISMYSTTSSKDIYNSVTDINRNKNNIFYDFFNTNILKTIIQNNKPTIVALSILTEQQIIAAFSCAKIIKEINPNIIICMGGPLITKWNKNLQSANELFNIVDAFIIFEGCQPLEMLLHNVKLKKPFTDIPNLICKHNNKIHYPPKLLPFINHTITPDFHGLPLKKYFTPKFVIPITSSIGCCYGACVFCEHPFLSNQHNDGNKNICAKSLVTKMKYLSEKYKSNLFSFNDSCVSITLIKDFCNILINEKLNYKWTLFLRLEDYLSNDVIVLLSKAGCLKIYTGYESSSSRIIKKMRKRNISSNIKKIIKNLYKQNISLHLFIMFAFPSETQEEAIDTYNTIKKLAKYLKLPGFGFEFIHFRLAKNSIMFNKPDNYDISIQTEHNNNLQNYLNISTINTNNNSFKLYKDLEEKYSLLFKNMPMMIKNLKGLDSVHDIMNLLYLNKFGNNFKKFPKYTQTNKFKNITSLPKTLQTHQKTLSFSNNTILIKLSFSLDAFSKITHLKNNTDIFCLENKMHYYILNTKTLNPDELLYYEIPMNELNWIEEIYNAPNINTNTFVKLHKTRDKRKLEPLNKLISKELLYHY